MKTAIALLLAASTALADPPADAPVVLQDLPGRSLILDQGSITPYRGVLLDEQEDRRRERARVKAEVALETLQSDVSMSKGAFVSLVVGCIAASAAIATGITVAATHR